MRASQFAAFSQTRCSQLGTSVFQFSFLAQLEGGIWRYWKGVDLSLVLSNFFSYEAFSIQIVHLQLLFPQKRLNSCFENFIIGLRAQKARMAAIAPAMDRSWMALA